MGTLKINNILITHKQYTYTRISLFHSTFQFTMCNGPTNALVCNKTLIQMSHIKTFKTLKITPTCLDHQLIIIRQLFDPGQNHWLKYESSCVVNLAMRQHTFIRFACCIARRCKWSIRKS
jgi:hypothetical protein